LSGDATPPLAVALDLLPLAGRPTGVGAFCRGLLEALSDRPDVEVSGYAVARHAGEVRHALEGGGPRALPRVRTWPVPQRAAQILWQHGSVPSGELIAGRDRSPGRPGGAGRDRSPGRPGRQGRGGAGTPDVVHGTNFVVPPCRRAAEVVTVHDLTSVRFPELCTPASLAYPALVRRALQRGAFVHTHSHHVAGEVVALLDAPPERVRAVAPGVERQAAPDPGATAQGTPFEWPYLLAIGTVEPRKGYPDLVAAFGEMAAEVPELRLVIVGPDGWGSAAFEEALAKCPARHRVVRRGYVQADARDRILAHATALVYPSVYEGFGLPPLEAMAAGVPVVASDAGSLPEVLGKSAVVVPSGDVAALAAAMSKVALDEQLRSGLVERGRAHVASFTWEETARGMVALYRDAVEARR
jgi:glycosyltransferase involved in cell wall biosynthesis